MTTPQVTKVPDTMHISMFATATTLTVTVIPHAIIAFNLQLPSALVNLHLAVTLGFWLAGVIFLASRQECTHDPDKLGNYNEVDALERHLRNN